MTDTRRFIQQLAAAGTPVKPLPSPARRTAAWLGAAVPIIALVVASQGLRPDLLEAAALPLALLEWWGSVLTGVLAVFAAFKVSVPGQSRRWAWLPAPAAALWLVSIGVGCLLDGLGMRTAAPVLEAGHSECARAIAIISLPLGLVMLVMVRHAGLFRPRVTALLGALGSAALASAGVGLFHSGESSAMVLLWHVGAVALLSLLSLAFSRRLFGWVGYH